jgi:putative inorganic carbon (hco3(-)) transporter
MSKLISLENFFYLVIFSMPLYLCRISIFGLPTNIFEILAILAIIFFFIKKRDNFVKGFQNLPKFIFLAILLIIGGVLISILSNKVFATGFSILKSWFLIPIIFSYMLYAALDSKSAVEKVFASIYVSSVFVGIISIVYKIAGTVTYDNRLEAFYLSPNYLAMYLSSGIFFGYYFLIKLFQNKFHLYRFLTQLFFLLLILIPLYYTYSYGAWVSVCVALLTISAFTLNQKHTLFISILIAALALGFIFQANSQKFSNLFSERSSLSSRIMIWDASMLMIKQHPFVGIGPGNFQVSYLSLQKYFSPYLQWAVPEPHNILLAFWTQAGLLGLVGFLFLLCYILKILLGVLRNYKKNAALAASIFGFFIYTLLHGLIDTPYWKNDLSFLFWICVFLTLFIYNLSKSKA